MYSIDSSGERLSPLNIKDPLLRAELFKEIRLAQTDSKYRGDGWGYYEIQPAEALMPELTAWNTLGEDTLKWLIMVAAEMDNPRDYMPVGKIIFLPTAAWLRERIKYYMQLEGSSS